MQKTIRKKNKNKTNLAPLRTPKPLKNLRKFNKNQKFTSSNFDRFFTPKTSQHGTPKRPKNDEKNNMKKEPKKEAKKEKKSENLLWRPARRLPFLPPTPPHLSSGGLAGAQCTATLSWLPLEAAFRQTHQKRGQKNDPKNDRKMIEKL